MRMWLNNFWAELYVNSNELGCRQIVDAEEDSKIATSATASFPPFRTGIVPVKIG